MDSLASTKVWPVTSRGGQVLIIFVLGLFLLVAVAALAIDVGKIFVAEAQLQNAVDAAALAGASQLTGFIDEQVKQDARGEAIALAELNIVDGKLLHLAGSDIVFGRYIEQTGEFRTESEFGPGEQVDSMQVTGRREAGAPDGPIDLFFMPLFGIQVAARAVTGVGTQPRRYVVFVMDRSGSMCFDTQGIQSEYSPNADGSMDKSPTGWYWMPKYIYKNGSWRTAYFYARDDDTGDIVTDFLPTHIKDNLLSGQYFRYCERDRPSVVESGWVWAPSNVTIYSYYGPSYLYWYAQSYGPINDCDYALATEQLEPVNSSQQATSAFVDMLNAENDRAALVTYAWDGTLDQQLTDDWSGLKAKIANYDPRGATAMPDGMDVANDELLSSGRAEGYGNRVMILLTDGLANVANGTNYGNATTTVNFCGTQVTSQIKEPVAEAIETQVLRAKAQGVRIYAVSFGENADTVLMPLIAQETNGAYYYAPDQSSLTDIFMDIFRRLPPLLTY